MPTKPGIGCVGRCLNSCVAGKSDFVSHEMANGPQLGCRCLRVDVGAAGKVRDGRFGPSVAPHLGKVTVAQIMHATDVSSGYASMIKRGIKIPDPRHWTALQSLASEKKGRPLE